MRRTLVTALVLLALVIPAAVTGSVAAHAVPRDAARAATPTGSVPPAVAVYVQRDLIDDLDHQYGLRLDGSGVDFSQAVTGRTAQVFFFTEDARSGRGVDDPVVPHDQWVVPIASGGALIGSAIVSADLTVPDVRLVDWLPETTLAAAADGLDPGAVIVRDSQTSSWFVLKGRTVTPVIAGTSGMESPRRLDRLALDTAAPRIDPINPGTVGALAALVALVALALIALSVTRALARRSERQRTT